MQHRLHPETGFIYITNVPRWQLNIYILCTRVEAVWQPLICLTLFYWIFMYNCKSLFLDDWRTVDPQKCPSCRLRIHIVFSSTVWSYKTRTRATFARVGIPFLHSFIYIYYFFLFFLRKEHLICWHEFLVAPTHFTTVRTPLVTTGF